MASDILARIIDALVNGEPDATVAGTKEALDAGIEPITIVDAALVPGMRIVGERFSAGEYFLPNLIVSANAMKRSMALIEPELRARHQARASAGTIVLGTVKGDIHEIGKSLVGTMLAANGFEVHDLGVDVPTEKFVATVQRTNATLVGLSALLTTTMNVQRNVIEALETAGLRSRVKVMVGGAPVTGKWAQDIGADGYAEDAVGAVDLALRLRG